MSKIKEIKKEIQKTLSSPPALKQMVNELRMHNVFLRQKDGDIDLFSVVNRNLVEKVWKTIRLNELLSQNDREFKKLGLNRENLDAQKQNLIEKVNGLFMSPSQNPVEGFVKEGFLEFEVFKNKRNSKN